MSYCFIEWWLNYILWYIILSGLKMTVIIYSLIPMCLMYICLRVRSCTDVWYKFIHMNDKISRSDTHTNVYLGTCHTLTSYRILYYLSIYSYFSPYKADSFNLKRLYQKCNITSIIIVYRLLFYNTHRVWMCDCICVSCK
jgi:hypothetical protein